MSSIDYMRNREAYDAFVAGLPASELWQWQPPPWQLATLGERAFTIALWAMDVIAIVVAAVFGAMTVGGIVEVVARVCNGS